MKTILLGIFLTFGFFLTANAQAEVRSDFYYYYHPNTWDYGSNPTPQTYYNQGYRAGVADSQPRTYYHTLPSNGYQTDPYSGGNVIYRRTTYRRTTTYYW